jgi:hypothetical protein
MVREQTFFEIAATLLPVLLLTGVFTRVLRPPDPPQKTSSWRFFFIFVGCVLGAFAEISALNAVTTGRPDDMDRTVVPLAISFAIVGIGAGVTSPWLTRLAEDHPSWRKDSRRIISAMVVLAAFWAWSNVQLYRNIFELGDIECVAREAIDWPGGPNSNVFDQGIVPRRLALDQIAIFRARRAARDDGRITKNEQSELGIRKLLLDNDVSGWKLELDLAQTREC